MLKGKWHLRAVVKMKLKVKTLIFFLKRPSVKMIRDNKNWETRIWYLQKILFSEKNTIKANETVCDIFKKVICYLYTPSYAEFKNNSSASKNSGFIDESIEKLLRVGTIKESSTKSSVIIHFKFQQKEKKHLILDRP